jgi:hypothetical protein
MALDVSSLAISQRCAPVLAPMAQPRTASGPASVRASAPMAVRRALPCARLAAPRPALRGKNVSRAAMQAVGVRRCRSIGGPDTHGDFLSVGFEMFGLSAHGPSREKAMWNQAARRSEALFTELAHGMSEASLRLIVTTAFERYLDPLGAVPGVARSVPWYGLQLPLRQLNEQSADHILRCLDRLGKSRRTASELTRGIVDITSYRLLTFVQGQTRHEFDEAACRRLITRYESSFRRGEIIAQALASNTRMRQIAYDPSGS